MVNYDYAPPLVRPAPPRRQARRILRRLLAAAEVLGEMLVGLLCLLGPILAALWEQAGR